MLAPALAALAAATGAPGAGASPPFSHAVAPAATEGPATAGLVARGQKAALPLLPAGGAIQRAGAARVTAPAATSPDSPASSASPDSPADWCAALAAGGGGGRSVPVDLSAAHAVTRAFATDSAYGPADVALTSALASPTPLTADGVGAALSTYAATLSDVCTRPAAVAPLGPGSISMVGQVAVVRPGTATPPVPAGTRVAVIDLRGLPAVPDLAGVLDRIVSPLLASPVPRAATFERGHNGPVDEVFLADNVYATFVTLGERPPLPATGRRDVPIVLVTGDRMAPAAARLAAELRMAGRAWVVGSDVTVAVAESRWHGVAGTGVAVRTGMLDHLFRHRPPEVRRRLPATQDDPSDPTTAGYRHDLTVDAPDSQKLRVSIDANDGVDLDLFLLYDADRDGRFSFPAELIAYSAGATGDESVELLGFAPPGRYQAWVHGYRVPVPQGSRFDLTVDQASGRPYPDLVGADRPLTGVTDSGVAADALLAVRTPPAPVDGPVTRSFPAFVSPYGIGHQPVTGKPQLRAALVIAHGVTRLFFPYFDVVGDGIDGRLAETLAAVEAWDGSGRGGAFDILRRFGEVLHDGHQFVVDFGPPVFAGYAPIDVEDVDGRPVVRRAGVATIHPGDAVVAMDGRPIDDVYTEEYRYTSTASPGYRFDVASRHVLRINGPTILTLADPDGNRRDVVVDPVSPAEWAALRAPGASDRPSGFLGDLGAPDVFYLNLDEATSPDRATVNAAIAAAAGARAMVVDMRGYPGGNHYETAARLIDRPFLSPHFLTQVRLGPEVSFTYDGQGGVLPAGPPSFGGPIALVVGPRTVSAAENFSQMLVGAGRPSSIVGRTSAATNGNITGVQLPGGFGFTYTGMRVLNPDGSRFHGVGIVPTVAAAPTAADIRDGVDPELLAALDSLT